MQYLNGDNMVFKLRKILLMLVFVSNTLCSQNGWETLSTDNLLDHWEQKGGKALYEIKKGVITGTAKKGTPNSFLCTKKNYSDFILEYEIKIDQLNSGVQIRSKEKSNRIIGYQVEADPTERAFSGGIYDEGGRKWLYPLSVNNSARTALVLKKWNKVRVQALGNVIQVWINKIPVSNLVDNVFSEGIIGLQVHGVSSKLDGSQVSWKNIRIKTSNLDKDVFKMPSSIKEVSYLVNELTAKEKSEGWKLLWDGKTSKGWRGAKLATFPKKGWQIEKGVLTILETDGGESTGPGDIVTTEKYGDFELELEFKISKGANSGIKYYVDPEMNKEKGSAIGCEFQILDDKNHPDAKRGTKGNRTLGSLYDLIKAKGSIIKNKNKLFKGIGKWNKARIVSKGGKVTHWLNNEKVVEYDRFSIEFKNLVAKSKYKNWKGFGQIKKGNILLQDHGNKVSYRSIKLRNL